MEEKKKPINDKTIYVILGVIFIIFIIFYFGSRNDLQKNKTNSNTASTTSYTHKTFENITQTPKEKINIIDFSQMSKEEIENWCKENKINSVFTEEYSDTVAKNGFIRQSIQSGNYVYEGGNVNIVYSLGKKPTIEETNALKKAQSYAKSMHMSKQGVYDQLVSEYGEGFTAEAAQYAIDNINVDWNANALAKAKSYQSSMSMSKKAIYDQLVSAYGEQFTKEEAQYAIDHLED